MTCLQLPGGRVATDAAEMRSQALSFYTQLFGAEDCSFRQELLQGLPQLSPEEDAALDYHSTLKELTVAINQMVAGCLPRIDGLSCYFYKHFWNTVGPDVLDIDLECYRTGFLPVSCQRAALLLLQKEEKNCWPIVFVQIIKSSQKLYPDLRT